MSADLADEAVPFLPRGVRLKEDPARGWLLLGPERALTLDGVAAAVLQEVDGARSFTEITEILAEKYAAPRDQIAKDARGFLVGLMERRLLETKP
ncbi:MAG: pyrroloquinoline quinone biosynthesis peptide chaperone PqqD [Rhodobacteraceae bacterium]|nr:pyrroloquinoline quinone biosynthesis peptide chaperone PqqD [Paracoccaceae bacterium]